MVVHLLRIGGVMCWCRPDTVKEYMDHSQGDVLGLRYEQISIERLRSTILPAIKTWWHKSVTTEKPAFVNPIKSLRIFSPRVTFERHAVRSD